MTKINLPGRSLRRLLTGSAAIGLAIGLAVAPLPGTGGQAWAQGGQGQGQGQGHGVVRTPGGGAGHGSMGVNKGGSTGDVSTTEDPDSDKKGPKFGGGDNAQKPAPGTNGGRPVWAKEGIPEVELGRLSVARAPAHVIEKAAAEALSNWTAMSSTVMTLTAEGQPTLTMTVAQLYSLPAAQFAQVVMTYYPSIVRIDSPLENLGLMQILGKTGNSPLPGVTTPSNIDLAAIFLGSASDKTIAISVDTVIAMQTLLGLPSLTVAQATQLAAEAEAVRLAILIGHDG